MHYNRANSYLSLNYTEIIKFKAKYSEIVATTLKKISADNMKNMGLY